MMRLVTCFGIAIAIALFISPPADAQKRRAVRHPVHHAKLVLHAGHPIHRALPAAVVVRPARTHVVVTAPLVYLPSQVWVATTVSKPPRERLLWEDSEVIERDEGWVDANFGIDHEGKALLLEIRGKVQLQFAEATFANGHVQVVDFNERTHGDGVYTLLDFPDGRHVKTVRILGKSVSEDTKLTVYLAH